MTPLNLERLFDPPSELEAARARRQKALQRLSEARERNDSRDLHHASKALRVATTDVVRLELRR